jgi:hypothetical protein
LLFSPRGTAMTPAEQKAWLAGRDAVCREADKIAGNTADFGRDYRRAAGQVAAMGRSLTPPAVTAWTPPFEFDRYINGVLMAEGVTIERETTIEDAARVAASIASRGPNGEAPVLVYRAPTAFAPLPGVQDE